MNEGLTYFSTLGQIFRISVFAFYAIIFIFGLINVIAPKWYFNTFESWKAKKEPPKTYFIARRIIGIIIMCVIAVVFATPFIAYFHH